MIRNARADQHLAARCKEGSFRRLQLRLPLIGGKNEVVCHAATCSRVADFISSRVVPIITANFEFPRIPLPTDAGDIYSAIRPFGCLNTNPLQSGTGGTLPAGVNAVAGSVLADGYKAVGSGLTGITTRWFKDPAGFGEAQCIELGGTMAGAGGYVYMQPTANVVTTNLAVGEVIEMVSAVDIVGSLRGIPAWEAELIITKPFSGTSTRSNVHRHLNRTRRQACDRVGNRVVERRAAYLRGYGALFNGERQHSTIQALPWLAGWLAVCFHPCVCWRVGRSARRHGKLRILALAGKRS